MKVFYYYIFCFHCKFFFWFVFFHNFLIYIVSRQIPLHGVGSITSRQSVKYRNLHCELRLQRTNEDRYANEFIIYYAGERPFITSIQLMYFLHCMRGKNKTNYNKSTNIQKNSYTYTVIITQILLFSGGVCLAERAYRSILFLFIS